MDYQFWRGKKVFVTGHTGIKGSWLVLWLRQMGADVLGYSLAPPTKPSLFELAEISAVVRTVLGDIRDRPHLLAETQAFAPDIVLHFAAQSVVLTSYEDPIETFSTNVVGTATVLDVVRQSTKRCAVVNVTTDKVYENLNWVWGYRENDRLGGHDPYSASKACAEIVASSFRRSYLGVTPRLIGLASARAGNIVCGGDWTPKQLIPEAIEAFRRNEPVSLRYPQAIRPWQHVLDCLSGYLTLAEALYKSPEQTEGEWNFGPTDDDMQPVSRVVELLAKEWGSNNPWQQDGGIHQKEALELRLNSQKAARELRWRGRLSIEEALSWTASWYRRFYDNQSALSLCDEQIAAYMSIPAK